MLSHSRFHAVLAPMVTDLLVADAAAIAKVRAHRNLFQGDRAPVASAAASARRNHVVSTMRPRCSSYPGWKIDAELWNMGGYLWLVDDDACVRISKSTPEDRAASSTKAFQPTLESFPEEAFQHSGRETILIRLDGKPLTEAWVTAALLKSDGRKVHYSFDLRDLARAATPSVTPTSKPSTGITLPGSTKRRRSNPEATGS